MKHIAIVSNQTNEVVELRQVPGDFDKATLFHKYDVILPERLCEVVDAPKPTPQAGKYVVQGPFEVGPDTVTRTWESVDVPPPEAVPLWAFRAAMMQLDLTSVVDQFVETLPEPAKAVARIHLEYGNYIERAHPFFDTAVAGGISSETIDGVFRLASTLR